MEIPLTIDIDRPPRQVWDYLVDPDKMRQWMTGLQAVEQVSPGPNGAGAEHRITFEQRGKRAEMKVINTVFEPHRRIAIDMSGSNMGKLVMHVDYVLSDLGGKTRLRYVASCQLKGFQILLTPLIKLAGASQAKKFLHNLKRVAEA